jgi:hypothetical protein
LSKSVRRYSAAPVKQKIIHEFSDFFVPQSDPASMLFIITGQSTLTYRR